MRRSIISVGIPAAVIAAGCGSGSKTVDDKAVEQGIKQQIVTAGATVSKVDCPSGVESKTGATFKCDVTMSNGATGKVQVTQTSRNKFQYSLVSGSVQVPGATVEKTLQQDLEQKGTSGATVNCPDTIIVKLGTYFVCDVTGPNGHKGSVKYTFSSTSGTVDTSSVTTTA